LVGTVAAATLLLCCARAVAAGDLNRESCSAFAQTEASPGFRSELPDCRAYEMITPPYKGGWVAHGLQYSPPPVSPDGSHLIGLDFAGFAGTENLEQGGAQFGATYEFSRTPSGWTTEALVPPASLSARSEFLGASSDLTRSLWQLLVQSKEGEEPKEILGFKLAVRDAGPGGTPRFTDVGPSARPGSPGGLNQGGSVAGASGDLQHILISVPSEGGQLFPGDTTLEGDTSLYEYSGTGNTEPALVGVRNPEALKGTPHVNEHAELLSECGTTLGSAQQGASTYNAISADASVVYFTALHGACVTPPVNELYARVNGSRTVAISEPAMTPQREVECGGVCREAQTAEDGKKRSEGLFRGASEDGSKVFFTTSQPLLNGDRDTGTDLYEADLGPNGVQRLVQVSHGDETDPTPGANANVMGVARISQDGSHVYYAAQGVLTRRANRLGAAAEPGGFNLYVYDTGTGKTSFVATLVTKEEVAEEYRRMIIKRECKEEFTQPEVEKCEERTRQEVDRQLPPRVGLGQEDRRPFQATPDGRFAIFRSTRALTGVEDTSTAAQLFEYDAREETLVRVSIGACPSPKTTCTPSERFNGNGNVTDPKDEAIILTPSYNRYAPSGRTSSLSIAEDGTVVFASRARLTPGAIEGRENIYEFRDGNVYLISPGDEPVPLEISEEVGPKRLLGTDESGRDVFFFTTDKLVPQHVDTQAAWYDAREGGGFPAPAAPVACSGDACQGPLNPTPPLPVVAGSATQTGGETASPATGGPKAVTQARRLAKELKACRRMPRRRRRVCEMRARQRYARASVGRHGRAHLAEGNAQRSR
jgi:hypothetical protein